MKAPHSAARSSTFFLRDLPDGFIDCLDVIRYSGEVLNGAVVCNDHVLHGVVPETEVDELTGEPGADNLEFTSKDTASANVAKVK